MMIGLMLALSLVADPQRRPPPPPPPPPPDITAIAQYVSRLTVLEQHKQGIDVELAAARRRQGLGESHPTVVALKAQLVEAEAALAAENTQWREDEVDRLVEYRARLEADLTQSLKEMGWGPAHPQAVNARAEIADVTARIAQRTTELLAGGLEQKLLAETTRKDAMGIEPFLKLARHYAAVGRTADAERILNEALTLLRSRGK